METIDSGIDPWDASRSSSRHVAGRRRPSRALPKSYRSQDVIQEPVNNHRIWKIFAGQSGIYLVIATFIIYVAVSYLINIPYKPDQQLECLKKFLEVMEKLATIEQYYNIAVSYLGMSMEILIQDQNLTVEIDQTEKSCLTSAIDVCYFQKCPKQSIGTNTSTCVAEATDGLNHKMSSIAKIAQQFAIVRQCLMQQLNSSKKEVTIMSYTYTNSFNAKTNNSETSS